MQEYKTNGSANLNDLKQRQALKKEAIQAMSIGTTGSTETLKMYLMSYSAGIDLITSGSSSTPLAQHPLAGNSGITGSAASLLFGNNPKDGSQWPDRVISGAMPWPNEKPRKESIEEIHSQLNNNLAEDILAFEALQARKTK